MPIWVAGVDGCNAGWVAVLYEVTEKRRIARKLENFAEVLTLSEAPKEIAVDMAIGLHDVALAGGRTCEKDARQLLGHPRASSVFSAPTRSAVAAWCGGAEYPTVSSANRGGNPNAPGLSQQTFAILPRSMRSTRSSHRSRSIATAAGF